MSPETRAVVDTAKAECARAAARFRAVERLMACVEVLEAQLAEAERNVYEAQAKGYGQGYADGRDDWTGFNLCKDYGPCASRHGAPTWQESAARIEALEAKVAELQKEQG